MRPKSATAAIAAIAVWIAASSPASGVTPGLAVYVTDADRDIFVALYGGIAVELADCPDVQAARTLLQLPASLPASETTRARLTSDFALGSQPRIPCGTTSRFDADWPATTPVWADLSDSGNYLLPAPPGGAPAYAVPARCTGIKSALAIRERLQLPGVLQGLSAPAGLILKLVLDCGEASGGGTTTSETATPGTALSLHRFETFLTAESTGDTIFVARHQPTTAGASPVYLPIWRVDGRAVAETLLAGGAAAEALETGLKAVLGLPAAAATTALGFEAVVAVRAAAHVDLCLADCDGYVHRHAAFLRPGVDLGLTEIGPGEMSRRLTRLGEDQLVWRFDGSREAIFTGCDRLGVALGLPVPPAADWLTAAEAALVAEPGKDAGFACQGGAAETCVRRLADGAPLTQATFAAGAECPGAARLRVELPATVRIPAPLTLSGSDFQSIELAPKTGVARSVVTGLPGRPTAGTSSCILSTTKALIFADQLPRLVVHRLGLLSAPSGPGDEVVAFEVQNGALVLDGVDLGGEADGTQPLTRGVTLCRADLYVADGAIRASALGIQGVLARVLIAGSSTSPALLSGARFGLLLSADSLVRMHHARIVARTPLVLRGGDAVATSVELAPAPGPALDAPALQLERGAAATFTTSTASGFRCVASFADAGSEASFVLPGNDLIRDNTHLACGAPGRFSLLE